MLPSFGYVRPGSVQEAVRHLSSPRAWIHAGGTDLLGCLRDGVFQAETIVSLGGIQDLRGIRETDDGGLRVGAMTTIAEVAESPILRERFTGLAQAAAEVASPQLRNQGTLGGNLCQRPRCWYFRGDFHCAKKGGDVCYAATGENRYHCIFGGSVCNIVHPSDCAPALLALGASVRIAGSGGEKTVPLESFFILPEEDVEKENVLQPGEMVTDVLLPGVSASWNSSYRKARERGSWDFALAAVALSVRLTKDRVDEARVVLGGVAPIPWRSEAAEEAVRGKRLDDRTAREVARAAVRDANPLEHNAYKVALLQGVLEESLLAL